MFGILNGHIRTETLAAQFNCRSRCIRSGFLPSHAIYFRAWELLTPTEPPHGPARLSDSTQVKFAATQNTLFATLPDGRLWVETLAFGQAFQLAPKQDKPESIGGSNWVAVTADNYQTLGIQSNGSLWSLQRQWNPSQDLRWQTGPFQLTRIGSDTNWSQVRRRHARILLLKEDGTLWIWGTNGYSWRDSSNSISQKAKIGFGHTTRAYRQRIQLGGGFYSSDRSAACARNNSGSILELSG